MGNQNRDERGRFASGSGAAVGDHQAEQPADKSLRFIPGVGYVSRAAPDLHTARLLSYGEKTPTPMKRLSTAAQERIALRQATDARFGKISTKRANSK